MPTPAPEWDQRQSAYQQLGLIDFQPFKEIGHEGFRLLNLLATPSLLPFGHVRPQGLGLLFFFGCVLFLPIFHAAGMRKPLSTEGRGRPPDRETKEKSGLRGGRHIIPRARESQVLISCFDESWSQVYIYNLVAF